MTLELIPSLDNPFPLNVAGVKSNIMEMARQAKQIQINSQDDFKEATAFWKQAKDLKKKIDEVRKEAIEPYRTKTSSINDLAKELTDPLTEVESLVKQKVEQFQKQLEKLKEAEIEAAKAADPTAYIAPVEKSMRGDGAIAYSRDVRKFSVVDVTKVPLQYLKVDEDKVELALKMGLTEIPGINIYTEKQTILRSR